MKKALSTIFLLIYFLTTVVLADPASVTNDIQYLGISKKYYETNALTAPLITKDGVYIGITAPQSGGYLVKADKTGKIQKVHTLLGAKDMNAVVSCIGSAESDVLIGFKNGDTGKGLIASLNEETGKAIYKTLGTQTVTSMSAGEGKILVHGCYQQNNQFFLHATCLNSNLDSLFDISIPVNTLHESAIATDHGAQCSFSNGLYYMADNLRIHNSDRKQNQYVITCIDLSGTILWNKVFPDNVRINAIKAAPDCLIVDCIVGDIVEYGQITNQHTLLYCFDTDGQLIWQRTFDSPYLFSSCDISEQGQIVLLTNQSTIYVLDCNGDLQKEVDCISPGKSSNTTGFFVVENDVYQIGRLPNDLFVYKIENALSVSP